MLHFCREIKFVKFKSEVLKEDLPRPYEMAFFKDLSLIEKMEKLD